MSRMTRRGFVGRGIAGGLAVTAAPYFVPSAAFGANEKVVLALMS